MRVFPYTSDADSHKGTSAFTFVELLVVLAVLALLVSMVLPGMARTKGDSRGFRCLNNNRELNRAWRMWTDDNNDLLLYAGRVAGSPVDVNSRVWLIYEGLQFSGSQSNLDGAFSIRQSPMWPYCRSSDSVWKCPSDESHVLENDVTKPRAFSYAMNLYLGGFSGSSVGISGYRLYLKSSDITAPRPDRLFVFLDQRPDSINWGSFLVRMDGYSPNSPNLYRFDHFPGFYHDGAATFSYADGHGEIHRWQDPRTTPSPSFLGVIASDTPSPRNPDIAWLQDRATRPK